jgi:uncharacterized membrane protein YphA (DoxX/SURF4 family)
MSLLRAAARPMLSTYFVLSGVRALRNPGQFVADAQPVANRLVPAVQRMAPDQIADRLPTETRTLVRINGAVQAAGGLALATGKGRRFGAGLLALSLIPTTLARHPFWSRGEAESRAHDRSQFAKNVSLMGGVLIASADTEGKPSLTWRATEGRQLSRRRAKKAKKALTRRHELVDTGREAADLALTTGATMVGDVLPAGGRTPKKAAKQAKKAAKKPKQQAANIAKSARDAGQQLQDVPKKKASKKAQKQARQAAEKAQKQAKKAAKKGSHQLGQATDKARELVSS